MDDSGGTPRDLKTDTGTLAFATPRGVQVVTGIGSSAEERLLLLADFSCTVAGPAFDDATASSHAVFKTVPSTSVARTTSIVFSGNTLAPEVLYSDYQLNRGQDGSLGYSAPGVLADGVVPTWS